MRVLKIIALLAAISLLLGGCGIGREVLPDPLEAWTIAVSTTAPPQPPPEPDKITSATILACGDNLIHDVIYQQAAARTNYTGYDFTPVYENVRSIIESADIACINQETPISSNYPVSTYPRFNSPKELAAQLFEVGFDVISIANNHMLDKNSNGLVDTIELLRETNGLTVCGGYISEDEQLDIPIIEKNEIKFAFLAFTQHTNGLYLPDGEHYKIVYTDQTDTMTAMVEKARSLADVVVVNVHWGEEYTFTPNEYQLSVADTLAGAGADIIFGHHPHVIEPYEIKELAGRKVTVFYSLGNFASAQIKPPTLVGVIAKLAVEKNHTTGEIAVSSPELFPVVTHYGAVFSGLKLYPLSEYSAELAASHGAMALSGQAFDLDMLKKYADICKPLE